MNKQLQTFRNRIARILGIGLLLLLATVGATAQTANLYDFTATTGTFTPLVGATNSSLLVTEDDNISTNIALGFSFIFEGNTYNDVRVATNGYLSFGTTGTSAAANNLSTANTQRPGVAPLWDDLQCINGVKYLTSGIAPNRIFTAEWLNMEWNYQSTTAVISFQVMLYESTNIIEVIYRQEATAYNAGTTGGASIGIMGSAAANYISIQNVTTNTFSLTTVQNAITTKPATGQIYRFTPPPACGGTPAAHATGLTSSTIGKTSLSFTFTDASPLATGQRYLVVRYPSGATPTNPTDGVMYASGQTLGTGSVVSYSTATAATASGLTTNTTYDFYVYSVSHCGPGGPLYKTSGVPSISLTTLPISRVLTTGAGGDWTSTATWAGNVVPVPQDTVEVVPGSVLTIDAAGLSIADMEINGTVNYGTTPTSFSVTRNLTVAASSTLSVANGSTGKTINVAGNFTNNGSVDLSQTGSTLVLNGTTATQTVGGSGALTASTITNLTFNNTFATTRGINFNWTNTIISGTLTFTSGWVALGGGNSMTLGISGSTLGTLTYTAGNGFTSGKFGRWIGTTGTGSTIAASTVPTFGTGSFPFILGAGNACHFHKATAALTTAGIFSVEFSGGAGTGAVGSPPAESLLTFDQKTNATWTVITSAGYASAANHTFAIQGQGTYTAFSSNARLLITDALQGTHQAGTTQPMVQRTGVPPASVDGIYNIGVIGAEIPNQTVASGAWDNAATWSAGVPVCGQNLVINTADSIWLTGSMAAASAGQIQLNGKLTQAGSSLTIGCANFNNQFIANGRLTITGGQLNMNGNMNFNSGSIFTQTGGTITVDGNNGATPTSVLTGTPIINISTNLVTLTGGSIVIVDGHIGTATADRVLTYTASATPYPLISTSHTVQFGDGVSTQANSSKGFETSLATRFYFGNVVVNTLASSNAFVASGSATVIINGDLTITAGDYRGGTTTQINGGNIVNNGTFTNTGTLTFGQVTQANMATPTLTAQTIGQTVSGSGVFRNATSSPTANYANITINNTSTAGVTFSSAASLLSGSNTGTVSSNLTFTNGIINTGANTFILGVSTSTLGTLAATPVGGFGPGSTFSRWWATATAGQTIAASTIPTAGIGTYPFVTVQSASPLSFFARTAYIRQAATSTTGGKIAVKHNDVAGSAAVSIVDGAYTVESRTNANWDISTTGITGTPTFSIALSGSGIYEAINGNSRITAAAAALSGAHQAGTILPHAQRTAVTLADLTSTWYMGAANTDVAFYSVASGNWEDGSTWNKGIAPSCSDSVVIHDGHIVGVNAATASARAIGINLTGKLAVSGSSLTVGCTMNNSSIRINGNLTVSSGTVNINGSLINNPTGRLHQSGGSIIVDGNDNGTVSTSASGHIVDMFATTDTSMLLTGGSLTVVDPVVATGAGTCAFKIYPTNPVNVSTAHTLIFGDGVSTQPGNATNGFLMNLLGPGVNYVSLGNLVVNSAYGNNRFINTSNTIGILGNLTVTQGNYRMTSAHVVKGNIVNNDSLTNTNTLTLATSLNSTIAVNTTAQSISGTGKFYNATASPTAGMTSLTINNNSLGGVTIGAKLSVSGTLTLTRGIVNTTAVDSFRLGTAAAVGTLTGAHDSAYIQGPFYRTFPASRTAVGTYNQTTLFPVGKGGRYLGLMIDPTTNAGGPIVLSGEAFNSNSGTMGAGTVSLSNVRWETFVGAGNANFVSTNMLFSDSAAAFNINSKMVYAPSAAGAYVGIIPPVIFSPTPQKILYTLGQQILAVDFTGYYAYGQLTPCSAPIDQPTSLVTSNLGATSVTVSYTAALSTPSNYLVVRYPSGGTETAPINNTIYAVNAALGAGTIVANTTGLTFNQTGLVASTTYDYYVYAYNNSGCFGPVFNTVAPLMSSVTTCAAPVTTPTSASAVNLSNTGFVARWNPIVTPGATYVVDVSTNSGFSSYVPGYQSTSTSTDTFIVVTGLSATTQYYYRARAIDGLCTSVSSSNQSVITLCDPVTTFPYTESFSATLNSCAKSTAGAGYSYLWAPTTTDATHGAIGPKAGSHFLYLYVFLANTPYNQYEYTLPPMDLGVVPKALSYQYFLGNGGYTTTPVPLSVMISTNGGSTWTTVYQHTTSNSTFAATNDVSNWYPNAIDLSAYSGNVLIKFSSNSNYGGSICDQGLDEITISDITAPVLATSSPSSITQASATLGGNVTFNGNSAVTVSGVVIGTSPSPSIGDPGVVDSVTVTPVQNGAYSFNVIGLTGSTLYHYRAYATNPIGTTYGGDSTFTTLAAPLAPSITASAASSVGAFSASLSANVISDGGDPVTVSGIVYGTSTNPALGDLGVVDSVTTPAVTFGPFTINPKGLTHSTKYYFRAYAINGIGTTYSTLDSFTTTFGINTLPYAQDFEGGAASWTSVNLGTNNDWVLGTPAKTFLNAAHSGVNSWNTLLTGTYNANNNSAVVSPVFDFSSYATTPYLTFYHKFVTETGYDGLVVEISINNGTWTKLDNVLGTGGNYNTPSSTAWYTNTSTNGPIAPNKFSSLTTGVGSDAIYSSQSNGWIQSTTPLTGAAGEANVKVRFHFGSDVSGQQEGWSIDDIEVRQQTAPIVSTGAANGITTSNATMSGNIISNGFSTITASGIVFGTSPSPAIGDPGVVDSASTPVKTSGALSFTTEGLSLSTTYYYRAYAINALGTSYGADNSFTTLAASVIPSVNSGSSSNITARTATIGGTIISDGGDPVLASGIVYSTSSNPVIGDIGAVDSTTTPLVSMGAFTINPTGLTPFTKYYYRAYAINGVGTAYSVQDSFTTTILISSLPYTQDFESGTAGWQNQTIAGANDWQFGSPAKTYITAAHSGGNAWVTKLTGDYSISSQSAVLSPQCDFTTAVADPIVRFYHKFITEAGYDGMVLEISINDGAWTKIDNTLGTGTNFNTTNSYAWYNNISINGPIAPNKFSSAVSYVGSDALYASQDNGWIQSAARLTGAAGQANVKFRFKFGADVSGNSDGWAIDDIEIVDVTTPATSASAVNLTAIGDNTTTVNWTNGDGQGRLVVARLTSTVAIPPTDNVIKNALAPTFGPSVDSTGLGNYIVYKSNTSSVVVNGLDIVTDYSYDVYEFNGKYMHIKYAAAGTTNGSTLPVTLTSFAGNVKGADAILTWTTASEVNNSGFEVERSIDGRNFEKAGFVKGAGNSNKALNYSLTDAKAFTVAKSDVIYYRLKQVDFDGKFTYSQVVRVAKNAEAANALSVYPNPYTAAYSVSFTAAKEGSATIEMVDLQGKVVATKSTSIINGNNMVPMTEVTNLEAGVYFVRLTVNGETQITKLVKN